MKRPIEERVQSLLSYATTEEKEHAEWVANNPHTALLYALAAHKQHWHGCQCIVQEIVDAYDTNKA